MTAARRLDRLAVLQILQGGFECATGNAMAFLGLLGALSPGGSGEYWVQISLAFLAVGLLGGTVVLVGLLRMLAGVLNTCLRGRRFGMIMLLAGLLSCATCVCLPTSLVLCLYGWHVYGSEDVRKLTDAPAWAAVSPREARGCEAAGRGGRLATPPRPAGPSGSVPTSVGEE